MDFGRFFSRLALSVFDGSYCGIGGEYNVLSLFLGVGIIASDGFLDFYFVDFVGFVSSIIQVK